MKTINYFLMIILLSFSNIAFGIEYQLVRVNLRAETDMEILAGLGIDFEGSRYKKGVFIDLPISGDDKARIEAAGFRTEVLTENLESYYQTRLETRIGRGFGFGSMGGFYTFTEVQAQLDSMTLLYPNLVSEKDTIGYSTLGKPIEAVKISDNPNMQESEPEVLLSALHHAREPQSMMTILYYMWFLLENYGSDPQATYLVDNRQIWFVPVVNPDGYIHNEQTNPNGGGMWRKNGRDNNNNGNHFDSGDGVDLNRNYGYKWGYDNIGSSPTPSSNTYRGPSAFSEPETQSMRDFCNQHQFGDAFNYHTYSNLLIHPWAYNDMPTPDHNLFHTFGVDMTKFNGYTLGTPGQTVGYQVNGDSNDWMYGEQNTKPKIIAYTPEVGNFNDGFWPPTSRIIPLAEENLYPNIVLSYIVGAYPRIYDQQIFVYGQNNFIDPGEVAEVTPSATNFGLQTSGMVDMELIPQSSFVQMMQTNVSFSAMNTFDSLTATQPWKFKVDYATPVGSRLKFDINIFENGSLLDKDSLIITVGTPTIAFNDNLENGISQWTTSGTWALTTSSSHSPTHSITDSPGGNYSNNTNVWIKSQTINLTNVSDAELTYWTKWDIESGWDFGLVEISTNGGTSWNHLVGQYMTSASGQGAQTSGLHGYDGTQLSWIKETINMAAYAGQSVHLRFRLVSDSWITEDGWYVDDVSVSSFDPNSNAPPYIQFATQLSNQLYSGSPYPVEAIVLDDYGIDHVSLFYSTDSGSSYTEVLLTGIDSLYSGEIPALSPALTVDYYFQAWDTDSSYSYYPYNAPGNTLGFQIISSGQPIIFVHPTAITDTILENSAMKTIDLTIHNLGIVDLTFNITDTLFNGANWLQVTSTSGVISGNDSTMVGIEIDPAAMSAGVLYQGELKITSNDTLHPEIQIPVNIYVKPASGIGDGRQIPEKLALYANYPNPFNPNTIIAFDIPKALPVELEIINILGQRVAVLVNDVLQPGKYQYKWNGKNQAGNLVSSGIYFYRLNAGDVTLLRKMIFSK